MKYEMKIKREGDYADLAFTRKNGETCEVYLGSVKNGALGDRVLRELYGFHQCDDEFGPDDEMRVEGVGTFKVVGKIHIDVADEDTARAVSGVTEEKPYRISYDGLDGNGSVLFATVDEAAGYVKDRWQGVDYVDGKRGFHTDYGRYALFGFDLSDIGKCSGTVPLIEFAFQIDCSHGPVVDGSCAKCGKKLS